jgi:uncharacterized protein
LIKTRKVPLRVCIGCMEKKTKKELIRVVRTPEDGIEIDHTGKKSGRGVYVCAVKECLDRACKTKRFEKNLKKSIPPEIVEKIYSMLKDKDGIVE